MKFNKYMLELWELAGKIGSVGESDLAYAEVYKKLAEALDAAEEVGLITEEGEG